MTNNNKIIQNIFDYSLKYLRSFGLYNLSKYIMQKNDKIDFALFEQVHMHVGQIVEAKINQKAKIPAYIYIDFGEIGTKISSAQLTQNYTINDLIDKKNLCGN